MLSPWEEKLWQNLDSILESRNMTLLTKVYLLKAMVFPVVCMDWESDHTEGWTQRTDAFKLWCWRRLLRFPWAARRSNQSILKEIKAKYSLEELMLKLKIQTLATWCEELTHWKRLWYWERMKEGGEGDDEGWDGWMASPTGWTWVWANSRDSEGQGSLVRCSPWGGRESGTALQLKDNYNNINIPPLLYLFIYWWTLRLFICLAKSAAVNTEMGISFKISAFIFFR